MAESPSQRNKRLRRQITVPRLIAITSLLVAALICAAMLLRRFDPIALLFFAPAFLLPVISATFACAPKRKRSGVAGAMVGCLIASAGLVVAASLLSADERMAHGMYGLFDFTAFALVASAGGCLAIGIGFGVGSVIGKTVSS